MSTINYQTMSLGVSSQKARMHVHFWNFQEAMGKNDSLKVAEVLSKASAEDSQSAIRFLSLYSGNQMDVAEYRQGKGNGKHAGHPSFDAIEIEVESVAVKHEKSTGKASLRSKLVESAFDEVDQIQVLIYGDSHGTIADSPNNVSYWQKVWHAYCLADTGRLPKAHFARFVKAAKLDKRTLCAEIAENWRTLSPSMMLAKHTSDTESRQAKTGKRTTRKNEPVETVTAETATA